MKTAKLTFVFFTFTFSIFTLSLSFAQEEKSEAQVEEKKEVNKPNSINVDGETVAIKDGVTTVVEFVSQGSSGLIRLQSLGTLVSYPGNNLYNSGGDLFWGGSKLGTAQSAGGWTHSGTKIYNSSLTDNVGIGTNNPTRILDVNGSAKFSRPASTSLYIEPQSNHVQFNLSGGAAFLSNMWLYLDRSAFTKKVVIGGTGSFSSLLAVIGHGYFSGNVGIGQTSPNYNLHVKGDEANDYIAKIENTSVDPGANGLVIEINSSNPGTGNGFIEFRKASGILIGEITGNGGGIAYKTTSDARLKMNVEEYENALKVLSKIGIKKYERILSPGIEEIGVIAQELQKVFPEAVSGSPDSDVKNAPMMVDYGRLTPLLVKAVQEQQEFIQSQELSIKTQDERIKKLEKQNTEFRDLNLEVSSKNEELENRLSKIESLLDGVKFTSASK